MKTLTVAAFICIIVALTRADPPAEAKSENDQTAETELVKRVWRHPRCPHGWRGFRGRCVYIHRPQHHGIQLSSAETDLVKRTCRCPYGWRRVHGRCFRYVSRPLRWAQAERNCQRMGGNLASVHSYWEYCAIQRVIIRGSHKYKETWIGGHDGEEERVWLWSNGKRFTYQNWCRGEPNNYRRRQHCLTMNHTARRCWDDDMCYKRKPSVCVRRRR